MGVKWMTLGWLAPALLAAAPAQGANWGLIGEYRADGQSVFVDTDSIGRERAAIRHADILTILARDVDGDAAFRLTIEIDCAAGRLRARDARTLDAAGRERARDATIGGWGDAAGLAFGARLVNYLCLDKDPPAPLLGGALPIAVARRHLLNPNADW